jgi:hypothetical protein
MTQVLEGLPCATHVSVFPEPLLGRKWFSILACTVGVASDSGLSIKEGFSCPFLDRDWITKCLERDRTGRVEVHGIGYGKQCLGVNCHQICRSRTTHHLSFWKPEVQPRSKTILSSAWTATVIDSLSCPLRKE